MTIRGALATFLLGLSALFVNYSFAADPSLRSVLVLNQTTSLRPWSMGIIAGIRSSLRSIPGNQVSTYVEHLDLYNFRGSEYEGSLLDHLAQKYHNTSIDVMLPIGPGALAIALKLRTSLGPTIPIVFASIDQSTATRNVPPGVTGTAIQLKLADMMKVAQMIVPNFKQFAIVGDRFERQLYYRHFADELPAFTSEFQFIDLMGLPMSEVRPRVGTLPQDSVIFYIPIISDQDAVYASAAEAFEPISEVANRPIIVDTEGYIGRGALGGPILISERVGRDAGHLVMRVLNGEDTSNIPITTGDSLKPIFDWRQLQRWNVSERLLPPESEILFRPPTMWEQYRFQILAASAALLVQFLLICWLFFEHRRRHLAEVQSRNLMSDLAYVNRSATAGELSASIAHEVNQPLAGIVTRGGTALQLLCAEAPDLEKVRAALEQMINDGLRAGEIVASVRAMFKKDADDLASVDMNKLILIVLELVRIDLQKNMVQPQAQLAQQLPTVSGDKVQLQQVVLNLVINAIEAMESMQHRVLTVRSQQSAPGKVTVSVEDTGAGVDPSKLDQVFKPLFTTKKQGMGMGLSICRSIIENHGGRIWASAPPNGGSIFQFELPANINVAAGNNRAVPTSAA